MDAATQAAIDAMAAQTPVHVPFPIEVPGRHVHIDGDYLAYQAGAQGSEGEARIKLLGMINDFRLRAGAEKAVVHLTANGSGKGGRYFIATVKPYQGNRSGHRPDYWEFTRDFMERQVGIEGKRIEYRMWHDREADDGIAHCVWVSGYRDAIAMKDKDSRMIPGLHVQWSDPTLTTWLKPRDYDVIGTDELQYGSKWFLLQMLHGDAADGIPGLEKIISAKSGKPVACGEVTARNLLDGVDNLSDAYFTVVDAYRGFYQDAWADRFVEQAALLWMRRDQHADICDFLTLTPAGLPVQLYIDINDAAVRLRERVREEARALEAITNQGDS